MTRISTAFSSCPNDTFIFHAMLDGLVDTRGLSFEPHVSEVDELNRRAFSGDFMLTKLSFYAYLHLREHYLALTSGAALGFGCGPLLVSSGTKEPLESLSIAIPGEYTTAHLLLQLWRPGLRTTVARFDEIMPGVRDGRFGAGIIIHEGRFVYEDYGLAKIVDLGEWWESATGLPIPLGCIALRRDMAERFDDINAVMASSVAHARSHPEASREFVRKHAKEMDAAVIDSHIGLYVNDFTEQLGETGGRAISRLEEKAMECGLI